MRTVSIVISDTSSTVNQHLKTVFEQIGLQVHIANDGEECLKMIFTHRPKLALIDLMLPKQNALTILKELKNSNLPESEKPKVVILSNQGLVTNIKECIKWGAADFLLKPLDSDEIVSRMVFHLQPSRDELKMADRNDPSNLYLHLIELILAQVSTGTVLMDTLHKLMQMTAMSLKSVRASVVECEPNRTGIVRASSDDARGNQWNLDLRKYPEILFVLNTGKTLVVENLDNDPTLNQIKKYFSNIVFNSLIVVPLYLNPEEPFGVLSIRMPPNRTKFLDEELRYAQIIARCISLTYRICEPEKLIAKAS